MQFSFMPEKETIDTLFISENAAKRVLCKKKKVICMFCVPKESFLKNTEESVGMGTDLTNTSGIG